MNEDMSKMANDLSNILKEKNIDLNTILSNLNSSNSDTSSSNKKQTSSDLNSILNALSSNNQNSSSTKNKANPDLNPISNMSSNSSQNNSSSNSKSSSGFDTSNIDIETILKFKKILDSINSTDDSRSHLLLSLKPYLKHSRKEKVDQYVKILNMTKLINLFGGDKK